MSARRGTKNYAHRILVPTVEKLRMYYVEYMMLIEIYTCVACIEDKMPQVLEVDIERREQMAMISMIIQSTTLDKSYKDVPRDYFITNEGIVCPHPTSKQS